jgi:exodeoxyribonuclease VII small subunit
MRSWRIPRLTVTFPVVHHRPILLFTSLNRDDRRVTETPKNTDFVFESALKELETLVEALEQGDLSLQQSLEQFERGVKLTRECQQALNSAEQRVDMLLAQSEDSDTEPYAGDG